VQIVALGASTGGIDALRTVLSGFSATCPPTLTVQHMKGHFLPRLPLSLAHNCRARVVAATDGMCLVTGTIYVAASAFEHLAVVFGRKTICRLIVGPPVSGHCPSVDCLFRSLVPFGPDVSAALLTGMGRDGAAGLLALRNAGARTIAQNEATSIVYGMPKAARENGGTAPELPIGQIAASLLAPRPRRSSGVGR
jgi:two-component system chemotaxis response regulator CheB